VWIDLAIFWWPLINLVPKREQFLPSSQWTTWPRSSAHCLHVACMLALTLSLSTMLPSAWTYCLQGLALQQLFHTNILNFLNNYNPHKISFFNASGLMKLACVVMPVCECHILSVNFIAQEQNKVLRSWASLSHIVFQMVFSCKWIRTREKSQMLLYAIAI